MPLQETTPPEVRQTTTPQITRANRRADRTSELRKKGFEGRRLGPVQMTTDTAVRVTRLVVQGKSLFDSVSLQPELISN